jgi:two-component system, OmpR family, sensor histidine kinase MtrB
MLTFSGGFLALSILIAATTYTFTRSTLLKQREKSAIEQAYHNTTVARNELRTFPATGKAVIDSLTTLGIRRPLINYRDAWTPSNPRFGEDAVPSVLRERVLIDNEPARMIVTVNGEKNLVVGVPLPEVGASYFEFFSLSDIDSTLRSVGYSLLFAGFITTIVGVVLGSVASRRAVKPLGDAAQAAKAIAGGRLDTRLETTDDHDLRLLANSFNDMASALQLRVERDARFASDVSHELRSPLMTLAASVEVMQARRDEMPERAQAALDLLVGDVARFQGLVEDLLEISRFDAGAIRLHREDLLVAEFVRQAVGVSSVPNTPVKVTERAERLVMQGDRRRLARVIANLIDNARLHGGGEPEVYVSEAEHDGEPLGHVWIAVEDHGAGVPSEERHLVFERFARGAVAGRRSSSDGAGLGLALVDEHVRLHGGNVRVEDRRDGEAGARFVIELPAEEVGV